MSAIALLVQCALVYGLSLGIYRLVKWCTVKTSLDNIPGPPSVSFLQGNMGQLRGLGCIAFLRDLIDNYGGYVVKVHNIFNRPALYVFDPKALHTILIKDESIWEESPSFIAANLAFFGPGLLSTLGEQHRKQRKMLNPVFSTNHMKAMLPTFYDIVGRLHDALEMRVKNEARELDMAKWIGRTALELIGQGGLGYSFDKLVDDKIDPFAESLTLFSPIASKLAIISLILPYIRAVITVPPSLRFLASFAPISAVREWKYHTDFVAQKSREVFKLKKHALEQGDEAVAEQIGRGKDVISILMKANTAASEKDSLSDHELVSQMSTLVFAGTDTTSNTVSRILQLLAQHPTIQQKLRAEIIEARQGENLPYDCLMGLSFLDAVCRETLRLHPPLLFTSRVATRDVVVPLSKPIYGTDGALMSELTVSAGTEVLIGTLGCNTSKAFWGEDALEWKPERWLSPLPESITGVGMPSVTSNLMSFLGGKRACIGFKFAEMEMKVVLSVLLRNFTFSLPADKEINWIPAPIFYPVFTRNLEELQTMWDRARAQNAELRGQLRKAQEQSGSHKQGQGSLNANDLAERVYSLLGDNAELRRENRRLLEQSRRRNGRQYSSGSDSEPSGDKPQSSTVLNSDDVSAKKSHRVSVPEVVASNGNNNDNTELVQSARADERTMRLLLRCVTRITQETARYERKKCDNLFKLSCGHVLCTFCMVPHDLIEPSPQRLCLVCKQAFAETAPLRIYQIKEESWAKLRAIAAKWAELDSDPLGELDDGLKAELAELCKRATQAEDESEAEDSEEEVEMNVTARRSTRSIRNYRSLPPPIFSPPANFKRVPYRPPFESLMVSETSVEPSTPPASQPWPSGRLRRKRTDDDDGYEARSPKSHRRDGLITTRESLSPTV
ncbi:cytochrome P450 [Daedalea quercina L-15889]|uniref:Cytochrome P450 n=1 Tax=Daedalea quercina L-15889 TaxID=1314783 RepID=A0A165R6D7_9APHY|nr:cytochrome P450 [Daedalea quercina L-15889]